MLERLLPKLALGDVAEIDGRYLCIVGERGGEGRLYLPFEGDHMLALIISKAFLLARDDEIDDPTITAQIAGR